MRFEPLLALLTGCTLLSFKPMYPCEADSESPPESTPPPDPERLWSEADLLLFGEPDDRVGWSFSGADVTRDGGADLLIGAPTCTDGGTSGGCVGVVWNNSDLGAPPRGAHALNNADGFATASGGGGFGAGIAAWTGAQGAPELVVGAPEVQFESNRVGYAYLFPPPEGATEVQQTATLLEGTYEDYLGLSVVNVGDVNGDGAEDLVVGAPYDGLTTQGSGVAWLLQGGSVTGSGSIQSVGNAIYSTSSGAIGLVVASLDNNQDGFQDLVFGTGSFIPNSNDGGAWLLEGSRRLSGDLDSIGAIPILGSDGEGAGAAVAAGDDLDGDGLDDIAVGAPQRDEAAGRVYILPGPIAGLTDLSTAPVILVGTDSYMYVGSAVGLPGDVNGDGYADLLTAGFVGYVPDQADGRGAVWLFHGPITESRDVGAADITFTQDNERSGGEVVLSRVGDVDGDGAAEIAFAYPNDDSFGQDAGAFYLFYGPL